MKLEVKPAVATFAAGMCLTVSIGVASTQQNSIRVDDNITERSDSVTASFGGATMTTKVVAPSPQGYYWTKAWQQEETQALREIAAGDVLDFANVDDLLAWLDEPEA